MRRWPQVGLACSLALAMSSCATLQQIAALRQVDFSVNRLSNVRLAGVDLARVRSYSQLSAVEVARLATAVAQRTLPLDMTIHLTAENPEDNSVDARLVRMDWTLLLQERETLSGTLADETVLRRGQATDVPLSVSVDLVDFFQGSAQDLFALAASIADPNSPPTDVSLRATPTVDTAIGPIRYPRPITIVHREVGG
jgi:hypothetical protein